MSANDGGDFEYDLQGKIERVIAEHLGVNGGGLPGAWMLCIDYTDREGRRAWFYGTAPGQHPMMTLGLIEWARALAHDDMANDQHYNDEDG